MIKARLTFLGPVRPLLIREFVDHHDGFLRVPFASAGRCIKDPPIVEPDVEAGRAYRIVRRAETNPCLRSSQRRYFKLIPVIKDGQDGIVPDDDHLFSPGMRIESF